MRQTRLLPALMTAAFFVSLFPNVQAFAEPLRASLRIDLERDTAAFSVRVGDETVSYRALSSDAWSAWEEVPFDEDVGTPGERESDLVILPRDVLSLEFTGVTDQNNIHLIEVSPLPPRVWSAAITLAPKTSILSRQEWGADESFLFEQQSSSSSSSDKGDNGSAPSSPIDQRVKDCEAAQAAFPHEFKAERTATTDASGRIYRWPLQYSPSVKLLVVHHSALLVRDDPRSPVERVRALYKYHAQNRGWGDIGYNYVIDEEGQIYEGRHGGRRVIAGHAYCNNTGTLGIVLLGNFDLEQPSQEQVKSLQHLLRKLADENNIDLRRSVQFHGKNFLTPILGHKDLLSTACPGYYLANALSQIRSNVADGRPDTSVVFPAIRSSSSSSARSVSRGAIEQGISYAGRTMISINPGGKHRLSFRYTAPEGGSYEGKKIANLKLSHPDLKVSVDDLGREIPVKTGILLPADLPGGEMTAVQLIVQAPLSAGNYTMDLGGILFQFSVFGRRARTGSYVNPFSGNPSTIVAPPAPRRESIFGIVRPQTRRTLQSSSRSSVPSSFAPSDPAIGRAGKATEDRSVQSVPSAPSSVKPIRIRLSNDPTFTVTYLSDGYLNDLIVRRGTELSFVLKDGECTALHRGARFTSGPLLRLTSTSADGLTVRGVKGFTRTYRGTLECQIVKDALGLINELDVESYLLGLAEEPDTQPYEKQRAFAIAARTYARHYMESTLRKFPGLPYDGSDDPAIFQAYTGIGFESANPEWTRAVRSTANQVLLYENQLIRPPYFSSDDGRTRSPEEVGWKTFPFAFIFTSKDDPWCKGMTMRGHGVGMSGCGALGQAKEGKTGEQILNYYYPGARIGER